MNNTPKVTVFIPVYNRAAYVGEAIASMLRQRFTDFELLLIDDGSSDNSLEVIKRFTDPRIRLLVNERNLGQPLTRNRGSDEARGEYLALLDSDDLAEPERLARQVAFLDSHPDHALVGCWNRFIDAQGKSLHKRKRHPVDSREIRARMLFQCRISHRAVMARTEVMRRFRYNSDFKVCQDYDLFSRISEQYALGNVPGYLVKGRIHAEQITETQADAGRDKRIKIMARMLDQLGVTYSENDVLRHYYLPRKGFPAFKPDREYLEWAEGWLARLLEANQRRSVYPEPEFSRALSLQWSRVCWQTRTPHRFWRSDWRTPALTAGWRKLLLA
ncbi:MAG: glycosyltransferase family A protein [Methylococcales bacterium]|nr:glycosyltransferase family A protein [Methylococcales bacterium]